MKPLLILKMGSTFPETSRLHGDFEDWIISMARLDPGEVILVNVQKGEQPPDFNLFSGIVISGSHSMVTDRERWMAEAEVWVQRLIKEEKPLLGICFGHQVIASAMGGMVDFNKKGLEIGTVDISLTDMGREDVLFRYLPERFSAHVNHIQTVTEIPEGATVLAGNIFDPFHALRIGKCAWSVQFHPEFNLHIMGEYIDQQKGILIEKGFNLNRLKSNLTETKEANQLIRRFVQLISGRVIA